MKSVKRPIKKVAYLAPRLVLTGVALFGMVTVVMCSLAPRLHLLGLCRDLSRAPVQQLSPVVVFGPYPHREELQALKQQGVVAVISLLDHNLLPERMLQALEEKNARALDLKLFKVPMSSVRLHEARNAIQVRAVLQLLEEHPGKFYIHCYGGRRRVGLVQQALKDAVLAGGLTAKSHPEPR